MRLFIFMALLMCPFTLLFAQDQEARLWGKQEAFLKQQATEIFSLVNAILDKDLPSAERPSRARQAALLLLDGVFHDTRMDGSASIVSFMSDRMERVLDDFRKPLSEGLKIYKLYNDGFIVRTKDVTVAFDLYRGGNMENDSTLIDNTTMRALVENCDLMFLSHDHSDHVDPVVIQMFTDAGKTVVATSRICPDNDQITHVRSGQLLDRTLVEDQYRVSVKILPGHQDEMENNIYVVTVGDYTIAHTGDQYNKDDLEWLRQIKTKIPPLDVLLVNCWAYSLYEMIEGFAPKLVITGHENELGHSIDHRESYWLSYSKLEKLQTPSCLMTWGECFWYGK